MLEQLLERVFPELDSESAVVLLRNPHLPTRWIAKILKEPRLASAYAVRRAGAFHPRTPRTLAMELVAGLYWVDLAALGVDPRIHPAVRRAADERLLERLPALAVGEKISLARRASPRVLQALRRDPTPRVVAALLENPRMTETLLVSVAASEQASPAVLEVIAENWRWRSAYEVRVALCRNPRTPLATALGLLPLLKKPDLWAVAHDLALPLPVRRRAELLAGEGPRGRKPSESTS